MTELLEFSPPQPESEIDPKVEEELRDSAPVDESQIRDSRHRLIALSAFNIECLTLALHRPIVVPNPPLNTVSLHQGDYEHRPKIDNLNRLVAFRYMSVSEEQQNPPAEISRVLLYRTTRLGQIFCPESPYEEGTVELLHRLAQRVATRLVPKIRNVNLFTTEGQPACRSAISRDQIKALLEQEILLVQDALHPDDTRLVMLNPQLRRGPIADRRQPVEQRTSRPRVTPVAPAHLDDEPRSAALIPADVAKAAVTLLDNFNGLITDLRAWLPRKG